MLFEKYDQVMESAMKLLLTSNLLNDKSLPLKLATDASLYKVG